VREVNARGVELARDVAGPDRWVLGNVGPCCGKALGAGTYNHDEVRAAYDEHIRALAEAGVDALLIETITDSSEMKAAVAAAREAAPGVPVITSLCLRRYPAHDQFRLVRTGESLGDCITLLRELQPDAVGVNCGADITIFDYSTVLAGLRAGLSCPLLAKPNAGRAAACGEEVDCAEPPEMMVDAVWGLIRAGASMVGGCCGTTPEHIRLFREELDKL
jgi:methionine synthase I (cobalamin-dependent)